MVMMQRRLRRGMRGVRRSGDGRAEPDVPVVERRERRGPLDRERIHDITTSLEAEVPYSATRVVLLYKLNSAFATPTRAQQTPAFGARFDVRVTQSLPFMNFRTSQWEMLVGVRNMFHESLANTSVYDEILVVRPPKRLVGGLTVKF